ncbi:MAG: hypothetical protein WD627_11940 [Actinomycetota bacterium]
MASRQPKAPTEVAAPDHKSWPRELWPLAPYLGVIAAASLLGVLLTRRGYTLGLNAAPLFGELSPSLTVRIIPAAVFIVLVVSYGGTASTRLSWSGLLLSSFAGAVAWAVALAAIRGLPALTAPLSSKFDALPFLPRVGSIADFLQTFTAHIATFPIHVQGHPPGLVVLLAGLRWLGVARPEIVAGLYILAGASTVPAVLVAMRSVAGENPARSAAPWLVLAPFSLWIATSPDALYAGVGAWALVLIVTAGTSRLRPLAGGLLFGFTLLLTYGAALLALIPAGVALVRRQLKPLSYVLVGVAAVVTAFAAAGFWWLDGLWATRSRYYAGLGGVRPYWYFLLADAAALAIACGPATLKGILSPRDGRAWILPALALLAVAAAALSGLSKGEVERIWLPFTPWIVLAAGSVTTRRRFWLATSAVVAMGVEVLVMTPW